MNALRPAFPADLVEAYHNHDVDATLMATLRLCCDLLVNRPTAMWHPLGFFRIDLGRDTAGSSYTIHCWPPGVRATQEPAWLIHRHAWDLESFVLDGALDDTEYDSVAEAATTNGTLYLASGARARTSRLDRTSRDLHLDLCRRGTMRAGRFYRVDIGQFHQSFVPSTNHCLTLARTGPRLRRNAQVLGDPHGPETLTYRHDPVDATLVADVLRSFTSGG